MIIQEPANFLTKKKLRDCSMALRLRYNNNPAALTRTMKHCLDAEASIVARAEGNSCLTQLGINWKEWNTIIKPQKSQNITKKNSRKLFGVKEIIISIGRERFIWTRICIKMKWILLNLFFWNLLVFLMSWFSCVNDNDRIYKVYFQLRVPDWVFPLQKQLWLTRSETQ